MKTQLVYLQGDYLPLSAAKVSVLDRGFLFADSVYEVIPAYFGRLFCFEAHIQRLENSLKAIDLTLHYSTEDWLSIFKPLLIAGDAQYIYVQITRGVAEKRDHAFPEQCEPTVFAMCSAITPFNPEQGVAAITLDDIRWQYCHIKSTALLGNILLRQQAVSQHSVEAILIDNGVATEGAASNVFAVIDGVLTTPPKSKAILAGITRDVIIQLAAKQGMNCVEQPITEQQLRQASEIWLSSSTREILPVVQLDKQKVAAGKVGPVWQTMQGLFQAYKRDHHG